MIRQPGFFITKLATSGLSIADFQQKSYLAYNVSKSAGEHEIRMKVRTASGQWTSLTTPATGPAHGSVQDSTPKMISVRIGQEDRLLIVYRQKLGGSSSEKKLAYFYLKSDGSFSSVKVVQEGTVGNPQDVLAFRDVTLYQKGSDTYLYFVKEVSNGGTTTIEAFSKKLETSGNTKWEWNLTTTTHLKEDGTPLKSVVTPSVVHVNVGSFDKEYLFAVPMKDLNEEYGEIAIYEKMVSGRWKFKEKMTRITATTAGGSGSIQKTSQEMKVIFDKPTTNRIGYTTGLHVYYASVSNSKFNLRRATSVYRPTDQEMIIKNFPVLSALSEERETVYPPSTMLNSAGLMHGAYVDDGELVFVKHGDGIFNLTISPENDWRTMAKYMCLGIAEVVASDGVTPSNVGIGTSHCEGDQIP